MECKHKSWPEKNLFVFENIKFTLLHDSWMIGQCSGTKLVGNPGHCVLQEEEDIAPECSAWDLHLERNIVAAFGCRRQVLKLILAFWKQLDKSWIHEYFTPKHLANFFRSSWFDRVWFDRTDLTDAWLTEIPAVTFILELYFWNASDLIMLYYDRCPLSMCFFIGGKGRRIPKVQGGPI